MSAGQTAKTRSKQTSSGLLGWQLPGNNGATIAARLPNIHLSRFFPDLILVSAQEARHFGERHSLFKQGTKGPTSTTAYPRFVFNCAQNEELSTGMSYF
jgi:hypothetical protein